MGDIEGGAWFYTREGEKNGPVRYVDLQLKVKVSGLDPLLDMVWTQGMAEWKPSGEIEGLFTRATSVTPRDAIVMQADPTSPPAQGGGVERMENHARWPGVRRERYLFATLILPLVICFIIGLATPFLITKLGEQITGWIALGTVVLPILLMIYYTPQRLANLGMSRWWAIGYFIPLVNIWVGYLCIACPAGYAIHKKMDSMGVLLAIIYWLLVLLALLFTVLGVALMLGAIGSPEIQQQFQEALRATTAPSL